MWNHIALRSIGACIALVLAFTLVACTDGGGGNNGNVTSVPPADMTSDPDTVLPDGSSTSEPDTGIPSAPSADLTNVPDTNTTIEPLTTVTSPPDPNETSTEPGSQMDPDGTPTPTP